MAELLNKNDVGNLSTLKGLKEQVKELEAHLKPRIKATFEKYGACNLQIGAQVITLSKVDKSSMSWKGLAESQIDADVIEEIKGDFISPSSSFYAKHLCRADKLKTHYKVKVMKTA